MTILAIWLLLKFIFENLNIDQMTQHFCSLTFGCLVWLHARV